MRGKEKKNKTKKKKNAENEKLVWSSATQWRNERRGTE